ncbi:MAG: hypothetical protein Q8R33_14355 [Burkholderiales bacterium]|nr:hypothetical protein [Burkholderiales bacterium]
MKRFALRRHACHQGRVAGLSLVRFKRNVLRDQLLQLAVALDLHDACARLGLRRIEDRSSAQLEVLQPAVAERPNPRS